jgi:hypothetical protein
MRLKKRDTKSIVGKFARYNEIINYINEIVANNPDITSSYVAGKTYENRDLKTLVIKTANTQRSIWIGNKNLNFFNLKNINFVLKYRNSLDCGFHAREWISPSTCVWMIDRLLDEYRSNDPIVIKLLAKYELHILILANPGKSILLFN